MNWRDWKGPQRGGSPYRAETLEAGMRIYEPPPSGFEASATVEGLIERVDRSRMRDLAIVTVLVDGKGTDFEFDEFVEVLP